MIVFLFHPCYNEDDFMEGAGIRVQWYEVK